jgi:hypothetical protein
MTESSQNKKEKKLNIKPQVVWRRKPYLSTQLVAHSTKVCMFQMFCFEYSEF